MMMAVRGFQPRCLVVALQPGAALRLPPATPVPGLRPEETGSAILNGEVFVPLWLWPAFGLI
jgi:hypothetical protein